MRQTRVKPESGWHVFWRTVLILLVGVGLIAVGFVGAMLVTRALAIYPKSDPVPAARDRFFR